jgi:Translation initiation factor IF-2, N-terminal region
VQSESGSTLGLGECFNDFPGRLQRDKPMPVTVEEFALALKVPVARLLLQLDQAGVAKNGPSDIVTEDDKHELLKHLRRSHPEDSNEMIQTEYSDEEKRSFRAWDRAKADREQAEKKISVGRAFDPGADDADWNPDNGSDRSSK